MANQWKLERWLNSEGRYIYLMDWAVLGDIKEVDVLTMASDAVGEQITSRDLSRAADRVFN